MKRYSHHFQVQAPLGSVADFHQDSRALKGLTPPPLIVSFNKVDPLAEGSVVEFTMWLGPLPIRWVATHSEVDPMQGFTDSQTSGPFEVWVHRHSFESVDDNTTTVTDQIQAKPSNHPFSGIISRFMWLTLPILFAYRSRQTRRALERK
jgi:ligand-binding SRPBCC domain-containing protein